MRRNVDLTALAQLARAWVSGLLALALTAGPAMAGDRALIDLIGYSADANYLAFEEYGIQDGSGFAYSNIYLVNLVEDAWVVGTPFRLQAGDETTGLPQVRAELMAKASETLATLRIEVPAVPLALNGDGAPGPGQALEFGLPGYGLNPIEDIVGLELSSFPTTSTAPCVEWFSAEPLGYQLSITAAGETSVRHRDTALPRSRGCPLNYRLYGVVAPYMAASTANAVAIISVYSYGFEGPDRRFIAVPLGL